MCAPVGSSGRGARYHSTAINIQQEKDPLPSRVPPQGFSGIIVHCAHSVVVCVCVQDSGGSVRLECVWPATIAVIIIIAVFYTIRHQIAGCFVRSVEYGVLSANIFGDSIALSQVSPYTQTHIYTVQKDHHPHE